jgi:glycosyltransferase involved in cell wall biosynthesis
MSSPRLPFVSVVIPVRNEARFIERTLDSVLGQDYPAERIEVIVADGMSDDGTREIIADFVQRDSRVCMLDNVDRVTPAGLNIAIARARGEIVCRIDGHCEVAKDFIRQNVGLLAERGDAWVVGGPIIHGGSGLWGRATAIAMSHPFGVGDARHRLRDFEGYCGTVQFPAFRRWVFDRVGLFDTALVRTEDDEFHYRITAAGGRIYVSPRVRYVYYVRERIGELYRQYFQYGFWRVPVIHKHKRPPASRQVVPLLFFLVMTVIVGIGWWLQQMSLSLALPAGYASGLLLLALRFLPKAGVKVSALVPLAVATMHVAYAAGMAYGLLAACCRMDALIPTETMAKLSR